MSANEEVRVALLDMGVDAPKSHQAAVRFHTVDAAINWVFGEGESVGGNVRKMVAPRLPLLRSGLYMIQLRS